MADTKKSCECGCECGCGCIPLKRVETKAAEDKKTGESK